MPYADSSSASGGVSGLSRIPGSMEVWWIGANGSVQDAYWYEGADWQRFELAPAGSAATKGVTLRVPSQWSRLPI
ncbi:hypothetical protein [Gorillibacterium massiliense]|uniref:hypothetical protein n=1 Tax=Gorillibacterium massiliense TaxID=1280390 RepID=UPI0005934918|nr:hypothetical protein [Gorillibacterium massiliense]